MGGTASDPAGAFKKKGAGERLEFNTELEVKVFRDVVVGLADEQLKGLYTQVDVPVLVNSKDIRAGEELVLEILPKRQAEKKEKNWKDQVAIRAKAKAKSAAAPVPKKAAASMYEEL